MKNISKKRVLGLLLALTMLLVLFAACGGTTDAPADGDAPATTDEPAAEEPAGEDAEGGASIKFSSFATLESHYELYNTYYAEPIKEQLGIDVEFVPYPDRQVLLVEVAGGAGPDVLDLDGPTDVVEFVKGERAIALDDYAAQYGWSDVFMDWAYNASMYDGKLYSLPTVYEGLGIFYNKTVMEENGWEYPQSLEELEALSEEILAAGLVPISFGNANYQGAVDWLYSTFLSNYVGGIDNMKAVLEGNEKAQDNAGVVAGMTLLEEFWQKGYIDNNSQAITSDDATARFASGEAVMQMTGTWNSGSLTTDYADTDWVFELMPAEVAGEEPLFPIALGGSYVINSSSENPDAAAEVLNFIFTGNIDNHYLSINESGFQPYPTKWFDTAMLTEMDPKVNDMYAKLDTAFDSNSVGYCSWTFYPAEMRVYMNENTDAVFLDTLSVEDYLAASQDILDAAIAEGWTAQLP